MESGADARPNFGGHQDVCGAPEAESEELAHSRGLYTCGENYGGISSYIVNCDFYAGNGRASFLKNHL